MRPYIILYGPARQIIDARSHDDAYRKWVNQRRSNHARNDVRIRPATPHEEALFRRHPTSHDAA